MYQCNSYLLFLSHEGRFICLLVLNYKQRRHLSPGKEVVSASDKDAVTDIMDEHAHFVGSMQSRLGKLQVFFIFIFSFAF